MIKTDIKIYPYEGWNGDLEISSGTCIAKGTLSNGIPYRDNAFKPEAPWYSLSLIEREALLSKPESLPELNSCINIVKIPASIIEEFELMKMQNITNKFQLRYYQKKYGEKLQGGINAITTYAQCHLLDIEEPIYPSFAFSNCNLETVTIYLKYKSLVGLHIDNFDGLDLDNIDQAKRRFCVNLGSEVRYLLFINLTISKLLEEVSKKKNEFKKGYSQWHLYTDFLRLYPDYPVIRVPLQPFEAYIAPAENMIHDGSTVGTQHHDLTLFYRGTFKNINTKNSIAVES